MGLARRIWQRSSWVVCMAGIISLVWLALWFAAERAEFLQGQAEAAKWHPSNVYTDYAEYVIANTALTREASTTHTIAEASACLFDTDKVSVFYDVVRSCTTAGTLVITPYWRIGSARGATLIPSATNELGYLDYDQRKILSLFTRHGTNIASCRGVYTIENRRAGLVLGLTASAGVGAASPGQATATIHLIGHD